MINVVRESKLLVDGNLQLFALFRFCVQFLPVLFWKSTFIRKIDQTHYLILCWALSARFSRNYTIHEPWPIWQCSICSVKISFGLRQKRSTVHSVLFVTEKVREAINLNQTLAACLIDLKKTSDTVDLRIFLNKLKNNGIMGPVLRFLEKIFTF